MSDLLITHVDVLTDEGVLKNNAIEIENGYITAILKDSDAIKAKDAAKDVLDGKGQLAVPGLVNTHTHIAMGLFRNYADDLELMEWLETAIWPTEAKLNDDYVRYGTQLGIASPTAGRILADRPASHRHLRWRNQRRRTVEDLR